jgi:glutamyl-tRNA reductase
MHELFAKQHAYDAVVVCTGGPAPWLELPHRRKKGLCIDAGSPPQVLAAPGGQQVGLDSLLSRPSATLPDEERERLEALVRDATHALSSTLSRPSQSSTLALIDAERTAFLNEQLPALLAGLPPKQIRRVRQAVGAFTHTILQRTREVSS